MPVKKDRTHMRGFASLSLERRREIARMGGKASGKSRKGNVKPKEANNG